MLKKILTKSLNQWNDLIMTVFREQPLALSGPGPLGISPTVYIRNGPDSESALPIPEQGEP